MGALRVITPVSAQDGSITFGEFSDGLDGWKSEAQNELSRISENDLDIAVTSGTYALHADVSGDPNTKIYRDSGLEEIDFRKYPYILAHVFPGPAFNSDELTSSDTTFVVHFYLYNSEVDEVVSIQSEEQEIARLVPQYISFDMSGPLAELYSTVDDETNLIPKRLEIEFFPSESDIIDGYEYEGEIVFDEIVATSNETTYSNKAVEQTFSEISNEHGEVARTRITSREGGLESGEYEYVDGHVISFETESQGGGVYLYRLDRESGQEEYRIEI